MRRVRRIFDLDADLRAVHAVLRTEPLLAKAIKKRPGLRVPGSWDSFELAVRAVLGQQVSVAGATTIARRLVDAYGEPCKGGLPGLDRVFPRPERLVGAPLELLGLPKSRATTLRSLARAMVDGRMDFGAGQRLDDFVERFTALPGIGPWTAHYVAMRALSQPDALPAGDLVLQQVIGGATSGDGERLSERAAAAPVGSVAPVARVCGIAVVAPGQRPCTWPRPNRGRKKVWFDDFASPIGRLVVAADEAGHPHILFDRNAIRSPTAAARGCARRRAWRMRASNWKNISKASWHDFDMELKPVGTPFQVLVWNTLAIISLRRDLELRAAGEIHRRSRNRRVRSCAANGRNPIPIVSPCHRVIGADGV